MTTAGVTTADQNRAVSSPNIAPSCCQPETIVKTALSLPRQPFANQILWIFNICIVGTESGTRAEIISFRLDRVNWIWVVPVMRPPTQSSGFRIKLDWVLSSSSGWRTSAAELHPYPWHCAIMIQWTAGGGDGRVAGFPLGSQTGLQGSKRTSSSSPPNLNNFVMTLQWKQSAIAPTKLKEICGQSGEWLVLVDKRQVRPG